MKAQGLKRKMCVSLPRSSSTSRPRGGARRRSADPAVQGAVARRRRPGRESVARGFLPRDLRRRRVAETTRRRRGRSAGLRRGSAGRRRGLGGLDRAGRRSGETAKGGTASGWRGSGRKRRSKLGPSFSNGGGGAEEEQRRASRRGRAQRGRE